MKYGNLPTALGFFDVDCEEMMFYQYLPIKLAGQLETTIDKRLEVFNEIIRGAYGDFVDTYGLDEFIASNIYITAKHLYQSGGCSFNRPGWHSDGFGSTDINYIWSNLQPTQFAHGLFTDISDDHQLSIQQFGEKVNLDTLVEYPDGTLLKLDPSVIHRTHPTTVQGLRTFIKISVSKSKYNLKGNSINHSLDYKWEMKDREPERNHPTK